MLFKLRVLSLLETYLHENPGKPQVVTVFSNLAQAFANPQTTEGSEQLGQRIWGIIQKKIFKTKDYSMLTHMKTSIVEGTVGYIAPEYYQTFKFTDKCGMYSFGVLLGVSVARYDFFDLFVARLVRLGFLCFDGNTSDFLLGCSCCIISYFLVGF